MGRLNKYTRADIRRSIVADAFSGDDEENEDRSKESLALGDAVYVEKYGKYLDAMSKLPDDFFGHETEVSFSISGKGCSCKRYTLPLSHERKMIGSGRYGSDENAKIFESWSPSPKLLAKVKARSERLEARTKARSELETQLRALLEDCSTEEELVRKWPEAKKYVGKNPLPTISVVKVRTALSRVKKLGS